MGRKCSVERLHPSLFNQVMETLQQNPGWTLDDHMSWLSGRGVQVSRSALGRFTQKLKNQAMATQPLSTAQDVRLRCLEVASSIYQGSEAAELQCLASALEAWIYRAE